MKILIIPDVHGRTFWKEPIKGEYDHIVFLGDYLDPYPGESTPEKALELFKEILKFKNEHPDLVTLLLGNHDMPYFSVMYGKALHYWCRHDYENREEIVNLFKANEDKFQIAWECDNEKYGKVLFTHAGVTNKFKHICGLDAEQINRFFLKESSEDGEKQIPNIVGLASVSFYRGGYGDSGSPVWADVREHAKSQVPQVFQIFGHTYSKQAIIMEHFAMLDKGDSCYILDEEGLHKFESNEN